MFGWPCATHQGIYNHGRGYTGVSGITAWPRAFEALADGLSQLNLGACSGMLSTGGDAWMCLRTLAGLKVKGLRFSSRSSEKRVLWRGICSFPAPKTSRPEPALGGRCFPPSVPGSQPPSPTSSVCFCWFWI